MCSLIPLRKAAYVWYRTMTAILLHRERGRNNAEIYAVLVVTPPHPLQREVTFQKGGVTTREYGTCTCGSNIGAYRTKKVIMESHMYTGTVTGVSPVRGITATTCTAVNECAGECSASSIPFQGRG